MDLSPFEFSENSLKFSNLLCGSEVYYRLIAPSDLQLRKRNIANSIAVDGPSKRQKSENSRRRRGRPRKGLSRRSADEKPTDDAGDTSTRIATVDSTPLSRTRYGRVTRPPKHMSKFIDINEPVGEHLAAEAFGASIELDNNFQPEQPVAPMEQQNEPKKVRRNLERFTCDVCKKIYLSKKKMLSHLKAFPDHKMPFAHQPDVVNGLTNGLPFNYTNSLIFNELIRSLATVKRKERCKHLLDELSHFMTHLNVLKDSLLPTCNSTNVDQQLHYVDKSASQLLGITEGNYNLNDNLLEHYQCQTKKKDSPPFEGIETTLPSVVSIQPSKYDLVPINEVNYDQITDNAMEAVSLDKMLSKDSDVVVTSPILDISLDMFQFNGA